MTQKNTTVTADGIELYDLIMEQINPDLLSTNDNIEQHFGGESDEDYAIRMEQYNADLEECGRRLQLISDGGAQKAAMIKEEKQQSLLRKETEQKTEEVAEAEDQLSTFNEKE